jgi:hypothetical protein
MKKYRYLIVDLSLLLLTILLMISLDVHFYSNNQKNASKKRDTISCKVDDGYWILKSKEVMVLKKIIRKNF